MFNPASRELSLAQRKLIPVQKNHMFGIGKPMPEILKELSAAHLWQLKHAQGAFYMTHRAVKAEK